MLILLLCLTAFFGGLVLGVRELLSLRAALSSGVIARKGHNRLRYERAADPERFEGLLANRRRGAAAGFGLCVLGGLGLGMFALAFVGFEAPLALVLYLAYLAFVAFAAYCLVQGLRTGHMFAIWSLTLFGEASRKGNPIWFWTYAAINLVIVLSGVVTVLGLMGG